MDWKYIIWNILKKFFSLIANTFNQSWCWHSRSFTTFIFDVLRTITLYHLSRYDPWKKFRGDIIHITVMLYSIYCYYHCISGKKVFRIRWITSPLLCRCNICVGIIINKILQFAGFWRVKHNILKILYVSKKYVLYNVYILLCVGPSLWTS